MPQSTKTFRVFVSSTFSDLKEERNALQKKVFPKLMELCMQHGFKFQAIDLRWGVSEEASLDQQTMKICLEEIERSQRVSPKPNFIVLLGDRYGWMPLPYEIPSGEFKKVLKEVSVDEEELLLWKQDQVMDEKGWYREDLNAVPPIYCLQPRTGIYEDYENWSPLEERLHSILLDAASKLDLNEYGYLKYYASATEQEIVHGALKVEAAKDHVFSFFRNIEDLPDDKDFVDIDQHGNLDYEAQKKLENLKEKLSKQLPESHIKEYSAKWTGDGISKDHLKDLCSDVYDSLKNIILDQIKQAKYEDPLENEIKAHDLFCEDRSKFFIGRTGILKRINNYLENINFNPLIIKGNPGSGKSSLMAYVTQIARENYPNSIIITRFINATLQSSDIISLLESLIMQVSLSYNVDESDIPREYPELVNEFKMKLSLATHEKPLIILLDAVNQLYNFENIHNLEWLPVYIPENVHIIISTTYEDYIKKFEVNISDDNIIELGELLLKEREELLDSWLDNVTRTLTNYQKNVILNNYSQNGLPLYLKLAFEEVRRWKSYTDPEVSPLRYDTIGIILNLLNRLSSDSNHGKNLVSKSLGYLTASRYGLSEDEILGVLSLDNHVLSDFKLRSPRSPNVNSLPFIIWSRLYFDLESYVTERKLRDSSLITFYHSQFSEVIKNEYLTSQNERLYRLNLAKFFELENFIERKVDEVPWQLYHAKDWDNLKNSITQMNIFQEMMARGNEVELTSYWMVLKDKYDMVEEYLTSLANYSESGASNEDVSLCLNHVATFFELNSKLDNAEILYKRAINFREKIYGENHPYVSSMLNNLATLLMRKGEYDKAEPLLKRALTINKEKLGDKHPFTIKNIGNLASVLDHKKDYDNAEKSLLQALEIEKEEYGAGHPSVAITLNNLADVYQSKGDIVKAKKFYKEALEIIEKSLGSEHPSTANVLSNYAQFLNENKEYEISEKYFRQALDIDEKVLGLDNIQTNRCMNNLGKLLYDKEEYKEAESLFKHVLDSWGQTLSFKNIDTIMTMNNYGMALYKNNDYDSANKYLVNALTLMEDNFGPEHPLAIEIFNNIMEVESARKTNSKDVNHDDYTIFNSNSAKTDEKSYKPNLILKTDNEYIDSCFHMEYIEQDDDRLWNSIEKVKSIPDIFYEGNYLKSLKIVENSLKKYPDFAFLYLWKGLIKKELKIQNEPYASYMEGLKKSKTKSYLCYKIGDYEFDLRHLNEAIKWWIRSIVLQFQNGNIKNVEAFLPLSYVANCIGLEDIYYKLINYHDRFRAGQVRFDNELTYKFVYLIRKQSNDDIKKALETLCMFYID